jgi:hypothetical protein
MQARESRALHQDSRKHGSETDSAPIIGDHKGELGGFRVGAANKAGFRNDLTGSAMELGDERNMSTLVDRRELAQKLLRKLIDRAEKSKPKGCARQRRKKSPQCVQIGRQDRTNRYVSRVVES